MAKPAVNILDVMNDPALLGKTFRQTLLRGDSWKTWRVFLAALFGLPLDPASLEIFKKHTGRSAAPEGPFQEAFLVCGRRSGKSIIMALTAVFLAAFRDYSDVLAPGESATLMVLASDRKQAQVIFRYIDAFLSIPVLKTMVVESFKESIELNNHIKIEIHTSSYKATRGFTLIGVICDELAFWSDESSKNPDKEILTALRPGLATTNGLLLGVSSPYAKRGQLWEEYKLGFGKDDAPTLVWQSDSRSMNPTLSLATVTMAYVRDAASAKAEYGGEFRSDIESFLATEAIERCVVRGRLELPPSTGISYSAFVDPSGGVNDSMTLAITHLDAGSQRAVVDCVRAIAPPFSPEAAVEEFAALLKRYRVYEVTGDAYGGEWPRESFSKRGITYKLSDQTRSELYLELLAYLMSGQVELLDNSMLINQLSSLERKTNKIGRDAVDHTAGGHDDAANAAAGALVGLLKTTAGGGRLGLIELYETGKMQAFLDRITKPVTTFAAELKDSWRRVGPNGTERQQSSTTKSSPTDQARTEGGKEQWPLCPFCAHLGVRLMRFGASAPADLICVQCGRTYTRDGSPVSAPETIKVGENCCGSPLPVRIANCTICNQCGAQSTEPQPIGISFAQFRSGSYRRGGG